MPTRIFESSLQSGCASTEPPAQALLSPSNSLKFADVPNGLKALTTVPAIGWGQILLYGLYCEAGSKEFGWFDGSSNFDFDGNRVMQVKSQKDNRIPGYIGWKPPLLATNDPDLKKNA